MQTSEDDNEKDFVLQNDVFIYYWAHDIHRLFRERLLSSTHESVSSIAMCEICRYICVIWVHKLMIFFLFRRIQFSYKTLVKSKQLKITERDSPSNFYRNLPIPSFSVPCNVW